MQYRSQLHTSDANRVQNILCQQIGDTNACLNLETYSIDRKFIIWVSRKTTLFMQEYLGFFDSLLSNHLTAL